VTGVDPPPSPDPIADQLRRAQAAWELARPRTLEELAELERRRMERPAPVDDPALEDDRADVGDRTQDVNDYSPEEGYMIQIPTDGARAALIDAEAAGRLLGVPATWVMRAARRQQIPHVRVGRYVRFSEVALREWADARAVGPVASPRDRSAAVRHG